MTRHLVLIGDGMSDLPLKLLGGKTPLEVARTPNMDYLAQHGSVGWVKNIPPGLPPGSDVAAMSLFGYDPKKYYSGRGPLEAASMGIKLQENELAFRCNLVTVKGGKMKDFTAGHIATAAANKIIKRLNAKLGDKNIHFYTGVSYRHILKIKDQGLKIKNLKTIPPHDITGQSIHNYLPKGKGAEKILRLMNESAVVLHGLKSKANLIWLWGQGVAPYLPAFKKHCSKTGAIITAVNLLKGIGKIIGLKVINVPGATGYLDTNYTGKAKAALRALKKHDVVFVHVEAPDEAGHEGNIKHKIKAIEDFDRLIVGTVLQGIRGSGYQNSRIIVLPDHPTPLKLMTHTADAVPFVIFPSAASCQPSAINGYSEKEVGKAKGVVWQGHKLIKWLLAEGL